MEDEEICEICGCYVCDDPDCESHCCQGHCETEVTKELK